MKNRKVLMVLIMIIVIILIICLSLLVALQKSKPAKVEKQGNTVENEASTEITGLTKMTNSNQYFLIKDCISRYHDYVSRASFQEESPMGEDVSSKESILNLLDESYIKEKGITQENIASYIPYGTYDLNMNQIYQWKKEDGIETYVVYGTYIETIKKQISENTGFIVRLDTGNSTFSILPPRYLEEKGYTNLKENDVIEPIKTPITNTYDNQYTTKQMTEAQIANEYFLRYKKELLFNSKKAYELLDEQYKTKRFGSVEEYNRYIGKNREFFQMSQVAKYQTTNEHGRKQYVCQDKYQNLYIFDAEDILDFDVTLDTYTLESKKFTEAYQKASTQEKVAMNLDKVVQMINNKDYKTIYSLLDERFKANYFATLESFEGYMEKEFPIYYRLNFQTFQSENDVLIQKVLLTDVTEETAQRKEKTFFMKLGEEENFVMSFQIP